MNIILLDIEIGVRSNDILDYDDLADAPPWKMSLVHLLSNNTVPDTSPKCDLQPCS